MTVVRGSFFAVDEEAFELIESHEALLVVFQIELSANRLITVGFIYIPPQHLPFPQHERR